MSFEPAKGHASRDADFGARIAHRSTQGRQRGRVVEEQEHAGGVVTVIVRALRQHVRERAHWAALQAQAGEFAQVGITVAVQSCDQFAGFRRVEPEQGHGGGQPLPVI